MADAVVTNTFAELNGKKIGMILLETQTASASASLNFTSFISSSYDVYRFELVNVIPATDGARLYIRVTTNGGSSWVSTSSYAHTEVAANRFGSNVGGSDSDTQIYLTRDGVDNASTRGLSGWVELYAPSSTAVYKAFLSQTVAPETAGTIQLNSGYGSYDATTAINGVQFVESSGNITSGIIRVFGIAK